MSGRDSIWWRGFWEQALSGGDTMVSVRLFDGRLRDMITDLEQAEHERAAMLREGAEERVLTAMAGRTMGETFTPGEQREIARRIVAAILGES